MPARQLKIRIAEYWAAENGDMYFRRRILAEIRSEIESAAKNVTKFRRTIEWADVANIIYHRLGMIDERLTNADLFFSSGIARSIVDPTNPNIASRIRGKFRDMARSATSDLIHNRQPNRSLLKSVMVGLQMLIRGR